MDGWQGAGVQPAVDHADDLPGAVKVHQEVDAADVADLVGAEDDPAAVVARLGRRERFDGEHARHPHQPEHGSGVGRVDSHDEAVPHVGDDGDAGALDRGEHVTGLNVVEQQDLHVPLVAVGQPPGIDVRRDRGDAEPVRPGDQGLAERVGRLPRTRPADVRQRPDRGHQVRTEPAGAGVGRDVADEAAAQTADRRDPRRVGRRDELHEVIGLAVGRP